MKKFVSLLFALVVALSVKAQFTANGYYRVQNGGTSRYIAFVDNHGSIKSQGATVKADTHSLQTIRGFSKVVSDPASVIYIETQGSGYVLSSQGIRSTDLTQGITFNLNQRAANSYRIGGTYDGIQVWLFDLESTSDYEWVWTKQTTAAAGLWGFYPISLSGDSYFGVAPDVQVGGKYFATLYAGFGFKPYSSQVKAYYVTKVDTHLACVVYEEITSVVPVGTPVFVECTGATATSNRLDLVNTSGNISDNCLSGLYFCYAGDKSEGFAANQTDYVPATQRVLGVTSEGKLGFVKSSTLKYLPANKAYLEVPSGSPADFTLVTPEEYAVIQAAGIEGVAADATKVAASRRGVYTLSGQRVAATADNLESLPAGVYIVDGRKISVK